MFRVLTSFIVVMSVCSGAFAGDTLEIDDKRAQDLKKFESLDIPEPKVIEEFAKAVFSKPISQQPVNDLKTIAKQANQYANLVGRILSEYASYYRDNYRYEFVQKKVVGAHDSYVKEGNKFKRLRDQAYFNLGLKMKSENNKLQAFFYFNDAFRLSEFDCGKGVEKTSCMRWKAEQEMQKILSISHIKSYVTWQTK